MKATCSKCGWRSKSHATRKEADQALIMHTGRVHGKIKVPTKEELEAKAKERALAEMATVPGTGFKPVATGQLGMPVPGGDPPKQVLSPAVVQKRREYQRLWRERQQAKKNGPAKRQTVEEREVRYCPHCGFPIGTLETAMAVVRRV